MHYVALVDLYVNIVTLRKKNSFWKYFFLLLYSSFLLLQWVAFWTGSQGCTALK